jgi:hypothetical protein
MIPKDIFTNLYLELYQAKFKGEVGPSAAMGRTVRLLLADCPSGRRGPSAWLVGKRCDTGRSGSNNRPSARVANCSRGRRKPSACATCVWVPGRGDENKQDSFSSPNPTQVISFLSFLLPLKEKVSLLGISIGALLGLSARFSTMSSGYFFRISHLSLGF